MDSLPNKAKIIHLAKPLSDILRADIAEFLAAHEGTPTQNLAVLLYALVDTIDGSIDTVPAEMPLRRMVLYSMASCICAMAAGKERPAQAMIVHDAVRPIFDALMTLCVVDLKASKQ